MWIHTLQSQYPIVSLIIWWQYAHSVVPVDVHQIIHSRRCYQVPGPISDHRKHQVRLSEAQYYHSDWFRSPERQSEWIISIYYYNKTLNALRLYWKTHIKMMNWCNKPVPDTILRIGIDQVGSFFNQYWESQYMRLTHSGINIRTWNRSSGPIPDTKDKSEWLKYWMKVSVVSGGIEYCSTGIVAFEGQNIGWCNLSD